MIYLMRLAGRNATTLPGKIAFRSGKKLPAYLTAGQHVTLITGTNGKTTTARILCSIYESAGYTVISNVSGANLISGIITILMEKRPKLRPGSRVVLEIDEGAFGRFAGELHPSCIIVTNLFRDQLDRYGELLRTRELIMKGISLASGTKTVLCADDSLVASLFPEGSESITFFGISGDGNGSGSGKAAYEVSTEAGNCVFCGTMYDYSLRTYGHLGIYSCPGCGYARPDPDMRFGYAHSGNNFYEINLPGKPEISITIPVPGEHNVYNAAAAVSAAIVTGIAASDISAGISNSSAGFGRMEKFEIGGRDVCIVLVKNPVGMDRALSFLSNASDAGAVQFILNDKIADGTDVSWIWDVDFESSQIPLPCHVSGIRAYDMALRLKYAGIDEAEIIADTDISRSFDSALLACGKDRCLYVFPNYTSLLELRSYLEKKYRLRGIWE